MLVKHLIQILKKYKEYIKNLNQLEENIKSGDDYLSQKEWIEIRALMYKDYVEFMNTPLDDLLNGESNERFKGRKS